MYSKKVFLMEYCQLNIRIPKKLWLQLHTQIPARNISKHLKKMIEAYLNRPNTLPKMREIETKILRLENAIQSDQEELAKLASLKLAIQIEQEENTQKNKEEFARTIKKSGQVIDSMLADGVLHDL